MLRQRTVSAVFVVLVAAIPAILGGPIFVVAMATLGVLASRELVRAFAPTVGQPHTAIALVAPIPFVALAAVEPSLSAIGALTLAVVLGSLVAGLLLPEPRRAANVWAVTTAISLYVALPLAHVVALRQLPGDSTQTWVSHLARTVDSAGTARGLAWFALALAATWLTDTGAYLVGRVFGRRKLAPRISPGKTVVGAVAGVVTGTAAGFVAAPLFGVGIPWYAGAAVGFLLAVVGQIGDLGESLIKRSLGIKDMGNLIPGHGGVLDRIDALLFTMPLAYWLARLALEVHRP
ncbi:MAG TPA: phosphatidate cytidylyltransferase [Thermomicrobiaceae bacterium]|nr:phosphatidate cytidylyltransferase [Thermomicrobiaceae bacterium]